MKNSVITKLFSGFLVFAVFSGMIGLAAADEDSAQNDLPARKIVVFKKGVSELDKSDALRRAGGSLVKKLRQRDMAAVSLNKNAEAALSKDAGVNVGVIDTGISSSHPDLIGNIKGGVSEVWYTSNWNDDNGHGSHVAGIVGAFNNTIGVVGGVPAANLYAIKVLNRNGSGYLSDVIDGIDWAVSNGMQVINLSLGTTSDIQSLHNAVIRAHNMGVVVVAAAGNSGGSVSYP